MIGARDSLTGYARARYDSAATNAQQELLKFAQNLRHDDLHTQMPDIVKKSGWNRQFKSHDKTNKRLMTGAEAAERDANKREQAEAREKRIQSTEALVLSLNADWTVPIRASSPPPATGGAERRQAAEREETVEEKAVREDAVGEEEEAEKEEGG